MFHDALQHLTVNSTVGRGVVVRTLVLAGLVSSCWVPLRGAPVFEERAKTRVVHYVHKVWQTKDGLPENAINTLTQTPDGYLWIGTQEGLVRFDGVQFTVFDKRSAPAIRKNFITRVFAASDSTLWIGTNGGGVVTYRDGDFKRIPLPNERLEKLVTRFCEDNQGRIWIGTGNGLVRYENGKAEVVTIPGLPSYPNIRSLAADRKGNLWIGTIGWGLWRWDGSSVTSYGTRDGLASQTVTSTLVDRNDVVWVGTREGGLARIEQGTVHVLQVPSRYARRGMTRVMMDHDSTIIVLSNGLWRVEGNRLEPYTVVGDNVAAFLTDLYWDHEGGVWVGTFGEGLHLFRQGPFQTLLLRPQVKNDIIFPITEDRSGALWFGTTGGGLFRMRDGNVFHIGIQDGLLSSSVQALYAAPNGALWVGTDRGLSVVTGSKIRTLVSMRAVYAIAADQNGTVWVGTGGGTMAFDPSTFKQKKIDPRLERLPVRRIQPDRSGALWLATFSDGVRKLEGTSIDTLDMSDGLSSNSVISMYEDGTGTLWLGTLGDGLNRYRDGKVTVYSAEQGLPADNVMEILDDGLGSFWISTNKGIVRVARKDLEDFAAGAVPSVHSVTFGENDGMLTSECNGAIQPAGWRASDGTLWFPTINGAVFVNPRTIPAMIVPHNVIVENVLVDNRPVGAEDQVTFAPGSRDLEFHFTAPAFANPEKIVFRYKLDGYNDDWIDAGTRRTAYYTNLPPGDYTFLVEAGIDKAWDAHGTAWTFDLEPYFYQTTWFLVACGLLAVSVGAGSFRVYRGYRDRMLQATVLKSQLAEARLKVLKMQLHPHFLFNTLNAISGMIMTDPKKSVTMIAKLSDLLRYSLENEFVSTVTLESELDFLKLYLGIEQVRFGKRLSVNFKIEPETFKAVVPSLILQPLVENAINHGIAKKVGRGSITISAERQNGVLRIEVTDDGHGMNGMGPEGVKNGVGLTNTKNRLRQMYGDASQLQLDKRTEGGVRVTMELPFTRQHTNNDSEERSA